MKPLVSILIPAYNAEPWIAETLHSALAQTWDPKEIVVVDDGSEDDTLLIAQEFQSRSVQVVKQKNRGPSATRNKALSLCQGDYIQWLDADDLLAPDKIAKQISVAQGCQSKRVLFSSAWGKFLYRHRKAKFTPTALWCDLSKEEFLIRKLSQNVYMQTANWLVTRELTEAGGPWDPKQVVDNDGEYFCRVLMASDGVRFVPDARVFYRRVGTSSVSYIGRSNAKLDALWRSMQLYIRHLRSLDDGAQARAACVTFLQDSLLRFFPERPDILSQAKQLARELGAELGLPRLSWKYAWIPPLFGWQAAKLAGLYLPQMKWSVIRSWDKALFAIESRRQASDLASVACQAQQLQQLTDD